MTNSPETRSSLLVRVRNPRDGLAWDEFVSIYEPLIYRFCRRRGIQDADAREITQDVLTTIADRITEWERRRGTGDFRAWLYRITRNRLINLKVHQSRHPQGRGGTDSADVVDIRGAEEFEDEYRRQLFRHAAHRVRREFSAKTWKAFWETSVLGRSVQMVATELRSSVGSIYTARSRVLARIKSEVQRELHGERTAGHTNPRESRNGTELGEPHGRPSP